MGFIESQVWFSGIEVSTFKSGAKKSFEIVVLCFTNAQKFKKDLNMIAENNTKEMYVFSDICNIPPKK